jgi:hypothetical protein
VSFIVTEVRTTNPKLQLSSNLQSVQITYGSRDEIHVIFPDVCHPSCTPADKLAVAVRCCDRHCPVPATSGSVSNTASRKRLRLYQNKTSWYRHGRYKWTDLLSSSSTQNVSATGPSETPSSTYSVTRPHVHAAPRSRHPKFTPPHVHATPRSRRPTFTPPRVPQDINQGMSPPDTLVGCQLMRLINVKLDNFSCCEQSYRTTTLSNYHKKYISHLTVKARLPITKTNYCMLFM